MEKKIVNTGSNKINRRKAITQLLLGSAGVATCFSSFGFAGINSSVTPNEKWVLAAFMETIVPGLDKNHPKLTRVFYDTFYQFVKYRKTLVKDLLNRSKKLFNENTFIQLPRVKREEVVQRALQAGLIKNKIYKGAIYLSQIMAYTGLFNSEGFCSIIDFKAEYNFESTTYQNYKDFLGKNLTFNGNYA